MNKENLIKNLTKFSYKFEEFPNEIAIKTNSKLVLKVQFKEEKIDIISELTPWNFLSGSIRMKIRNAFRYVIIASSIMLILALSSFFETEPFKRIFIYLYIFVCIWSVANVLYYQTISENLKTRIYHWLQTS